MLQKIIQNVFDVREGEFKISLLMQTYIFLIIAVLLIIKPTINAVFLSELGVEQLPFAFLAVAVTAIISSFFYSKALTKFPLNRIIEITLLSSVIILIGLGVLLKVGILGGWLLYLFYIWVAIYAVLTASQFWVLANLVYNVREAKRLFGFIGSGAILGGIFGGYLTSFLVPLVGNEYLIFLAAILLLCCVPLLRGIWRARVKNIGAFKEKKRTFSASERPFQLIKKSRHLTYIACIVAVSVLVAKLVDYLFSDFAASSFPDTEELTSFFAFWFSTFNLISLVIQLFFTHRIVGIWGVGFSLLLLPLGVLAGSLFFFILPELSAVIVIKAMDGVLKQSVHKSATELLSLPLPFDLKNKTKSFIDVVVDSIATGIAGFLLIFVMRGLELSATYIVGVIIILVGLWVYFILKVRQEYYKTFRNNLEFLTERTQKNLKPVLKKVSVLRGMRTVFKTGTEEQILFMLGKLMEINDKRFASDVQELLNHQSTKVRASAIRNLYYLNNKTMIVNSKELLNSNDGELTLATLEYLLLHSKNNSESIFNQYLTSENETISNAALYCLAREAKDNQFLKNSYHLNVKIKEKIKLVSNKPEDISSLNMVLKIIGAANIPEFYPLIKKNLSHENPEVVQTAIASAGASMHQSFVLEILRFLPNKQHRETATSALHNYGSKMASILTTLVQEGEIDSATSRFVPQVLKDYDSEIAIKNLFILLKNKDHTVRLESVRALSDIRRNHPAAKFNKYKIVEHIFEECKLHHQTLSAMHTQIIISYRNRRKSQQEISTEERDARSSLLEILERRLDAGLERIFKLLGLKYQQNDVEIAYDGLLSEKQEARINAIEFLDNLLTGNLKQTLLPIIEESALDVSSEEELQKIKNKVPTEMECFQLLLQGNDLKMKLAVLYLIKQQKDLKYLPIIKKYTDNDDLKISTFAKEALVSFKNLI